MGVNQTHKRWDGRLDKEKWRRKMFQHYSLLSSLNTEKIRRRGKNKESNFDAKTKQRNRGMRWTRREKSIKYFAFDLEMSRREKEWGCMMFHPPCISLFFTLCTMTSILAKNIVRESSSNDTSFGTKNLNLEIKNKVHLFSKKINDNSFDGEWNQRRVKDEGFQILPETTTTTTTMLGERKGMMFWWNWIK